MNHILTNTLYFMVGLTVSLNLNWMQDDIRSIRKELNDRSSSDKLEEDELSKKKKEAREFYDCQIGPEVCARLYPEGYRLLLELDQLVVREKQLQKETGLDTSVHKNTNKSIP